MRTTLNLRPGTHHLKFIVDGEMRAADTLPTAVDFTNHLVNYIEISADDARKDVDKDKSNVTPGDQTPQTFPDSSKEGQSDDAGDDPPKKENTEEEVPPGDFGGAIPQFLADLDKEEDSPAYLQAANVIGDTPTPPSLPLFLGKSILNSTTPTKDDSSVLNYPNHTVLNHLATSSIKNSVLATSVTTRYKRKVRGMLYLLEFPLSNIFAVCHNHLVQANWGHYGVSLTELFSRCISTVCNFPHGITEFDASISARSI